MNCIISGPRVGRSWNQDARRFFWRGVIERESHSTICFSFFILTQPLCSLSLSLPSRLLFLSLSVNRSLPLFVFVNKLCKQLNLSSGRKKQQKIESKMLYRPSFVFCDNVALCFSIGRLLLFKFPFKLKKKRKKREREKEKDTKWSTVDKECWKSGWMFWWKCSMLCFIRLLATSLVGWLLLLVWFQLN